MDTVQFFCICLKERYETLIDLFLEIIFDNQQIT